MSEENKISELNKSLEGLSLTEKLDYLLKSNMSFKFCSPVTTLGIPNKIYNTHFKNGLNNPKFTYWFLKFDANILFLDTINNSEFKAKMDSKLKRTFLQSELDELEKKERQAKELLRKKELDIYKPHKNNFKYKEEVVLLRILGENYYRHNTTQTISNLTTYEVQAYFKYFLFRQYLKNELKIIDKENYTLDDYYSHYLLTKRFLFVVFVKSFVKSEFENVRNKVCEYEKNYKYIFNKLDESLRLEFKSDTIDHLNSIQKVQTLTKYKILLSQLIKALNKSFDNNENFRSFPINDELYHGLRLYNSTLNYHLEKDIRREKIVTKQLTHDYLISKFDINTHIEKFYFSSTEGLITDEEFNLKVKSGYLGNIKTFLKPYPFTIQGAYFHRKGLLNIISDLINLGIKYTLNGNSKLEYLTDLTPYFNDYAQGFKAGFHEFENDCINPFLPMHSDKNDSINKIFEYLTNQKGFKSNWKNPHNGFTISFNGRNDNKDIVKGFEDGKTQGYFYRAWSYVLSNNILFSLLFKNYYTDKIQHQQNKTQNTLNKESLIKDPSSLEVNFEFENNFDEIEPKKVYDYFCKNLVDKKYFSKSDLEEYLLLAFQDKTLPKQKFTFSNLHIEKVRTIFYTYYRDIAQDTHGKKTIYAKLLGEYFNSFTTQKVINNFADGYQIVRK
jgi:hypothetical protein